MDSCIFCKIIAREIPAAIVYEDDNILSFMTIEAVHEGHLLVIPKKHIDSVHEMDEELYISAMKVARKLSYAIENAFNPKRLGLMVAGFEVPHAHIHVVPMNEIGDLSSKRLLDGNALHPSLEELQTHAEKIKEQL